LGRLGGQPMKSINVNQALNTASVSQELLVIEMVTRLGLEGAIPAYVPEEIGIPFTITGSIDIRLKQYLVIPPSE